MNDLMAKTVNQNHKHIKFVERYNYIKKKFTAHTPYVHLNKEAYIDTNNEMYTHTNNPLLIIFKNTLNLINKDEE